MSLMRTNEPVFDLNVKVIHLDLDFVQVMFSLDIMVVKQDLIDAICKRTQDNGLVPSWSLRVYESEDTKPVVCPLDSNFMQINYVDVKGAEYTMISYKSQFETEDLRSPLATILMGFFANMIGVNQSTVHSVELVLSAKSLKRDFGPPEKTDDPDRLDTKEDAPEFETDSIKIEVQGDDGEFKKQAQERRDGLTPVVVAETSSVFVGFLGKISPEKIKEVVKRLRARYRALTEDGSKSFNLTPEEIAELMEQSASSLDFSCSLRTLWFHYRPGSHLGQTVRTHEGGVFNVCAFRDTAEPMEEEEVKSSELVRADKGSPYPQAWLEKKTTKRLSLKLRIPMPTALVEMVHDDECTKDNHLKKVILVALLDPVLVSIRMHNKPELFAGNGAMQVFGMIHRSITNKIKADNHGKDRKSIEYTYSPMLFLTHLFVTKGETPVRRVWMLIKRLQRLLTQTRREKEGEKAKSGDVLSLMKQKDFASLKFLRTVTRDLYVAFFDHVLTHWFHVEGRQEKNEKKSWFPSEFDPSFVMAIIVYCMACVEYVTNDFKTNESKVDLKMCIHKSLNRDRVKTSEGVRALVVAAQEKDKENVRGAHTKLQGPANDITMMSEVLDFMRTAPVDTQTSMANDRILRDNFLVEVQKLMNPYPKADLQILSYASCTDACVDKEVEVMLPIHIDPEKGRPQQYLKTQVVIWNAALSPYDVAFATPKNSVLLSRLRERIIDDLQRDVTFFSMLDICFSAHSIHQPSLETVTRLVKPVTQDMIRYYGPQNAQDTFPAVEWVKLDWTRDLDEKTLEKFLISRRTDGNTSRIVWYSTCGITEFSREYERSSEISGLSTRLTTDLWYYLTSKPEKARGNYKPSLAFFFHQLDRRTQHIAPLCTTSDEINREDYQDTKQRPEFFVHYEDPVYAFMDNARTNSLLSFDLKEWDSTEYDAPPITFEISQEQMSTAPEQVRCATEHVVSFLRRDLQRLEKASAGKQNRRKKANGIKIRLNVGPVLVRFDYLNRRYVPGNTEAQDLSPAFYEICFCFSVFGRPAPVFSLRHVREYLFAQKKPQDNNSPSKDDELVQALVSEFMNGNVKAVGVMLTLCSPSVLIRALEMFRRTQLREYGKKYTANLELETDEQVKRYTELFDDQYKLVFFAVQRRRSERFDDPTNNKIDVTTPMLTPWVVRNPFAMAMQNIGKMVRFARIQSMLQMGSWTSVNEPDTSPAVLRPRPMLDVKLNGSMVAFKKGESSGLSLIDASGWNVFRVRVFLDFNKSPNAPRSVVVKPVLEDHSEFSIHDFGPREIALTEKGNRLVADFVVTGELTREQRAHCRRHLPDQGGKLVILVDADKRDPTNLIRRDLSQLPVDTIDSGLDPLVIKRTVTAPTTNSGFDGSSLNKIDIPIQLREVTHRIHDEEQFEQLLKVYYGNRRLIIEDYWSRVDFFPYLREGISDLTKAITECPDCVVFVDTEDLILSPTKAFISALQALEKKKIPVFFVPQEPKLPKKTASPWNDAGTKHNWAHDAPVSQCLIAIRSSDFVCLF